MAFPAEPFWFMGDHRPASAYRCTSLDEKRPSSGQGPRRVGETCERSLRINRTGDPESDWAIDRASPRGDERVHMLEAESLSLRRADQYKAGAGRPSGLVVCGEANAEFFKGAIISFSSCRGVMRRCSSAIRRADGVTSWRGSALQ
jgi:hypothetical protein